MLNFVFSIIIVIILSYLSYWIACRIDPNFKNKQTFFIFLVSFVVLIALNNFTGYIVLDVKEFFSPKPDIEVYLNTVNTMTQEDYEKFKSPNYIPPYKILYVDYLSPCRDEGIGMVSIVGVLEYDKPREGTSYSPFNTLGRGCDNCGHYNMMLSNLGGLSAEDIIIKGNFDSKKELLPEITPLGTTTILGETSPYSNVFGLYVPFVSVNDHSEIATIKTKEQSDPIIQSCTVKGDPELCTVTKIKTTVMQINRNDYSYVILFGNLIYLPEMDEETKLYSLNLTSKSFYLQDSNWKYIAGEGTSC